MNITDPFWQTVIAGILATVVGGIILAFIPIDSIRNAFRGFLKKSTKFAFALIRWILDNWQLVIGTVLLAGAAYGVYVATQLYFAAVLALVMVLAAVLLARYWPVPFVRGNAPVGGNELTILSGPTGEFANTVDGPWSKSVECQPVHGAWKSALQTLQGSKWVWIKTRPTDQEAEQGQIVWHRIRFTIKRASIQTAVIKLMVDDVVKVYVNDSFVREVVMTECYEV